MMVPTARFSGLALSSSSSASRVTFSSSSGMPMPVLAEISWLCVLPPHSSTWMQLGELGPDLVGV